jgi:hypothetical protein
VGVPVLGLLGILEAGRGISAPLSISGDWTLAFDPAAPCPSPPGSILQQIAFSVSQSGPEAVITLKDGYATALAATIHGRTLTAGSFTATISGERDKRTLDGRVNYGGCAPVAFHAVRQAPGSRGP